MPSPTPSRTRTPIRCWRPRIGRRCWAAACASPSGRSCTTTGIDRGGLDDVAAGRRINPGDAEAFATLRGAVTPEEWLAAGFTAQPAMLFAIFDGDRIVAAANLTAGPEAATDVGIVVHPDERGKGFALQVAAQAARQAILMHGIARFRALATSASTMAIARKLGFEEYGRNLAVYLEE